MPTGYTSFIEEGKIDNAKDFLNLCLRNFGVLGFMRHESLYNKEDYTEAIAKHFDEEIEELNGVLERKKKMYDDFVKKSDDELRREYEEEMERDRERLVGILEECRAANMRYDKVMDGLRNWDCSPEMENIKKFAIDQIEMSYEDTSYYEEKLGKTPTREDFDEWKRSNTKSLIFQIEYSEEELEKITQKKKEHLAFYKRFKEEVSKIQ